MNILGLSCFYHDAAACVVQNGIVVAAAEEERFNRIKHYADLPLQAINFCLQEAGITINDIDLISFYEKPFLKFSRVVIDHLKAYPFSFRQFARTIPCWLQDRLSLPLLLEEKLGYRDKVIFIKHHCAHAASTFLASPFERAAIVTVDGVGEYATATIGEGTGNRIDILQEMVHPHSLGLLYTAVTTYLGFKANEGEGTVMGLAGYGQPSYIPAFEQIIAVMPDGSMRLDMGYFDFIRGTSMYTRKFRELFGAPRHPGAELTQRHYNIAASLQKFTETVLQKIVAHALHKTGKTKLCLAGGIFLNCVANSTLIDLVGTNNIFIQPAAGDSGGALGSALYADTCLMKHPRKYTMKSAYLGKSFGTDEIRRTIINNRLPYQELSEEALLISVAEKIIAGNIVGWFQGKMELGPRALGNRSILADPRDPDMKDRLNAKVKHREWFRPFAPAVVHEKADEYFELHGQGSPFMLFAPMVRAEKRSLIPAVTHIDGTARVQTVNAMDNPRFYRLLETFGSRTGIPMLINTSFNLRGQPIVNTPQEAIDCFLSTKMDLLVLENFVVTRTVK